VQTESLWEEIGDNKSSKKNKRVDKQNKINNIMTSLSAPIIVVDNDECIGSWGAYRNALLGDAVDVLCWFFL
jgi:hypothetical protein